LSRKASVAVGIEKLHFNHGDDVESGEPKIEIEQVEPSRSENPGRWLFKWRVRNETETTMSLLSVRIPHGKFKAEERKFLPPSNILAEDSLFLEMVISCEEPPNTIIENAFLILLVDWQENHWRLFVRLQIKIDQQGRVDTATESVTVQQVGFSGVSY
jgi:hypothetical protein